MNAQSRKSACIYEKMYLDTETIHYNTGSGNEVSSTTSKVPTNIMVQKTDEAIRIY